MLKTNRLKLLYKLIKPQWHLGAKALILSSLGSVLEVCTNALFLPLTQVLGSNQNSSNIQLSSFLEKIVNFYIFFPEKWHVLIILLCLLFLTTFKNTILYFSSININKFTLKSGTLLRQKCVERFLELEVPFYNGTGLGELLSYVNEQAQRSEQLFSSYLELIREVLAVTFLIGFLVILSPTLTLVTIVNLTLLALSIKFVIKRVQINGRQSASSIERFSSLMTEIISGIRVIKSFNAEPKELESAKTSLKNRYETEFKAYKFKSAVAPLTETAGITVLLVILLIGTGLSANSEDSILAVILTYTLTLLRTLPRVNHLNSLRSQLSLLSGSFEKIQNFLSSTAGSSLPDGKYPYEGLKSDLFFDNLTFTFPSNSEPTLRDINFRAIKGTTTALVGSSGSGKSTLVDLVMRFYNPDRGSIKIDGIDLRDLKIGSWRRAIAMVSQDTFLFNASVRDNIAYGRSDATELEVIEAAKKAYAYEFIQDLPEGLDTIVGNRGTRLSGGQRQRIAIARAILCDPDLLILDEATSALDSTSERIVQKAIEEVSRDRTVIVIAHRLSTIEKADKIIVMHEGRVVEQGTHRELLALQGSYWSLHQSQVGLGESHSNQNTNLKRLKPLLSRYLS
ncbi:MAG: ABC transporter ATP-binding protein [Moorea sp. SIO3G5]|nr:ABC transporter ATP-binding protein [Moorena sp. SIO3G5]